MPMKNLSQVSVEQQNELDDALYYLNMTELRNIGLRFAVSPSGKKVMLIKRIMHFVRTGKELHVDHMPEQSKAKKGHDYPLRPETRIVYGSYRNDALTRAFFKQLIGPHFHFTAYGIDWINERWMQGNPPTYAEFATLWQTEHETRQKQQAVPKREWAYLSFLQRYQQHHPKDSKAQAIKAWNSYRQLQVDKVKVILGY